MNRPAGQFGAWLASMRAVLRGEQRADVPCDGCVGCCTSAYPIPLRPADRVAIEHVPDAFLHLPAHGKGTAWMGFREDGHCPMLEQGKCSIYADRPQTCRDYDCRLYAAAGWVPDGDRTVIQERVREWAFQFDEPGDAALAAAVREAAGFIRSRATLFPPAMRAGSATAAAVLAVKVCEVFHSLDSTGWPTDEELVRRVIEAAHRFDRPPQP